MKINKLFEKKKPLISFEIFPPNDKYSLEEIYSVIDKLVEFKPEFISVTYGAGGGTRARTCEIASRIKNVNKVECMAHLTCLGSTENEIKEILDELKKNNIENILALRGDQPKNGNHFEEKDFKYANDLISFVKKNGDFSIGATYYPEGHQESNLLLDLFYLKQKVNSGADFLISQIFFDNEMFYKFRDYANQLKIDVPLIAGIMPVTDAKQIKKITALCGASIPVKFQKILDKYENNPEALKEAGIAYAVEQIIDLVASDIDGIHLYTMNKIEIVDEIMSRINKIIK